MTVKYTPIDLRVYLLHIYISETGCTVKYTPIDLRVYLLHIYQKQDYKDFSG